jgi:hypothetical protein
MRITDAASCCFASTSRGQPAQLWDGGSAGGGLRASYRRVAHPPPLRSPAPLAACCSPRRACRRLLHASPRGRTAAAALMLPPPCPLLHPHPARARPPPRGRVVPTFTYDRAYDDADEVTAAYSIAFDPSGAKLYTGYSRCIRVFDVSRPGRDSRRIVTHRKRNPESLPGARRRGLSLAQQEEEEEEERPSFSARPPPPWGRLLGGPSRAPILPPL